MLMVVLWAGGELTVALPPAQDVTIASAYLFGGTAAVSPTVQTALSQG